MAFFGGGVASVDLASPPAIGNTTPNTGRFTSVGVGTSVSGSAKLSVLGTSDTSAQVIFNGAQWFGSVNGNQGVLYQGDIAGKVKVIALNQAFTAYRTLELVSDGNTFSFPSSSGTLVVSSSFSSPPAIGNTTPNTGAFTTVESTSRQFITSANGSVQLGRSGGNALGTDAINIQPSRSAADKVASGTSSVAIGKNSKAGINSVCISSDEATAGAYAIAIGMATTNASGQSSIAMGYYANGVGGRSVAIGEEVSANIQGEFKTRPFGAVYYNAQTTNNTATTMTIDNAAGTRFTIPANTAIMADLFIIARRTDTVDKWFSSRRTVAIRRNNANGTAIIGSVQNIGTDQTEGSPTWSVAVTADDTNEALQIQVTGETGETVQWRVLALYRFV